jgi:hypothetical protein
MRAAGLHPPLTAGVRLAGGSQHSTEDMTTMEIAKLVLEYVKALAWPLIVLALVLKFRGAITGILLAIGNRLASAETVKFGVLGQEVELSGTARELKVEQKQLLVASKTDREARERAGRVAEAIPELNNPVADMVGLALLEAPGAGLSLDELLERVVAQMGSEDALRGPQASLLLSGMSREIEKVLTRLAELGFTTVDHGRYLLSGTGRDFFGRVAARHKHLLERFSAKTSQSRVGA